jgi:hypothetical protein
MKRLSRTGMPNLDGRQISHIESVAYPLEKQLPT